MPWSRKALKCTFEDKNWFPTWMLLLLAYIALTCSEKMINVTSTMVSITTGISHIVFLVFFPTVEYWGFLPILLLKYPSDQLFSCFQIAFSTPLTLISKDCIKSVHPSSMYYIILSLFVKFWSIIKSIFSFYGKCFLWNLKYFLNIISLFQTEFEIDVLCDGIFFGN